MDENQLGTEIEKLLSVKGFGWIQCVPPSMIANSGNSVFCIMIHDKEICVEFDIKKTTSDRYNSLKEVLTGFFGEKGYVFSDEVEIIYCQHFKFNFVEKDELESRKSKGTSSDNKNITVNNYGNAGSINVANTIGDSVNTITNNTVYNDIAKLVRQFKADVESADIDKMDVESLIDDIEVLLRQLSEEKPRKNWIQRALSGICNSVEKYPQLVAGAFLLYEHVRQLLSMIKS